MNTYIRYLMFEAIPTPTLSNPLQYDSDSYFHFHSNLEQDPQTFDDIENQWHIPDIIYSESETTTQKKEQINPNSLSLSPLLKPPPSPSMPIKRSITVEYELCKTNPDGIRFRRLKYASIGYYSRISPKTREMIYTLLNIKILESYKNQPQYWEGVDIRNYLYRTKQSVQTTHHH